MNLDRRLFGSQMLRGACGTWMAVHGCTGSAQVLPDPRLPSFTPYDFGAVGNGIADDTAACNAAAQQAQKLQGELAFPAGRFAITQYLVVPSGVRRVSGRGGVIACANSDKDAGVLLGGAAADSIALSECRVEGLVIDCAGVSSAATNALYGHNVHRCRISGNRVLGLVRGHGILLRSSGRSSATVEGNLILDNRIEADTSREPRCMGIDLDGELQFEPPARNPLEQWRRFYLPPRVGKAARGNTIRSNTVIGGYYGISLSGALDNRVSFNRLQAQIRNISLQNASDGNSIEDNVCSDSISSAIHLAYGSSSNRIVGNIVKNGVARGEGLLQAYVGAADNLFEENTVSLGPKALPRYHIYVAAHADRNRFVTNRLSGACARAYVAVETGFNRRLEEKSHRAYRGGAEYDGFASRGMAGVSFVGNVIDASSEVPVFLVVQVSDEGGSYRLADLVIARNTVKSARASAGLVVIEQDPQGVSALILEDNTFPDDADAALFRLPRGVEHFSRARGNRGAPQLLR